jgi:5S rRNA maturation endonuclease (ribonuclease M5)
LRASTYRSSPDELRSRLQGLIRELNDEASRGAVVLVEGPRDEAALRAAGYSGPLIKVKALGGRARSLGETLSSEYRKAVLLVDFDREGSKLAVHIRRQLSFYGVEVDVRFRESFFEAFSGEVREVESLRRFTEEGSEGAGFQWI